MSGGPFHIGRDQFHLAWDASVPPVLTVASGSEIEFDALDASCGQITAESTVDDLAALDFSRVDQVCGPVFVEGAEPGDTLQVELLDFQPGDWGWTAAIPGFGLLTDEFPDAALRITRLGGGVAEFLPGVTIPLAPFCGVLGLASPGEPRSTIPPTEQGGNMDTRHLTAGADAVAAGRRSGRAVLARRRPRRPGRRRGLRDRHRDADAGAGAADGPPRRPRHRARVPDRGSAGRLDQHRAVARRRRRRPGPDDRRARCRPADDRPARAASTASPRSTPTCS